MLLGLPEIVVGLHGKPTLRRTAKRLGKTSRHFRADTARSLSDVAFVTRRKRHGRMQGRRPEKTGGVFTAWRQTFNATDMSTMYPYADHNTIPAAFIN